MRDDFNPRLTPWHIDEKEFYEIDERRDALKFLLRYAVLAPSGHNTQPWCFRVVDEGVQVFADYTRRLPIIDGSDRELTISIGAAITNFRVAAAHFGFETTVAYEWRPEESLPVATLLVNETSAPDPAQDRLFHAIPARHTNRHPFDTRPMDPEALASLCDFLDEHGDFVRVVLPQEKGRVADLVASADRAQFGDGAFRDELAAWLRPNATDACDGICGDGFGVPDAFSAVSPWLIRHFNVGRAQAERDRDLTVHAATLAVITADDDRVSLIRAGEALELLLLTLTTRGLAYSFMNQPIEVPSVREKLWAVIGSPRPPQLLLRIGYAQPVERAMPRRRLDAVMA